ncbi:MAG: hypothetical protein GVY24_05825 [Planctomycetes bacterium]|nr:hypothetical protein [Planctomycetota bacterium]
MAGTDAEATELIFALIPALFAVPFVLVGGFVASLGLAVMFGRNAVEIDRGRVKAIERVGLFRWSRKRPIEAVRKIEVVSGGGKGSGRVARDDGSGLTGLSGMRAECDGHKALMLAWGYPRAMLLALADAVADEANADRPARLVDDEESRVRVVERELDLSTDRPADDDGPETIPPQPASSKAVLRSQADGLTLRIPPTGMRKGSKGLFGFSLLWNGFMAVFTTVMVLALTGVLEGESDIDSVGEMIGAIAFVGLFWAVGIGMLLGAINAGRREAILDLIGGGGSGTLLVTTKSLFGTKQREWSADQISHLGVGPSGIKVNDVPVMELQVHPKEGKKVGLLRQLDDDELEWIAANLRVALGVPKHPSQAEP